MATITASFPERFKELVGETPYREIGEMLSISASIVSYYISGKRSPKVQTVAFIANEFGVDPVWLMGYDVPKYKKTPEPEPESLSKDKAELVELINGLSDDEVSVVLSIVRQALALRGK